MNSSAEVKSATSSAPRRRRWVAVALLVLMFFLGIVTGVGGGALVLRHRLQQRMLNLTKAAPSDALIDHFEKEIDSSMKLSDDERAAVKSELAITRDQVAEIRQRTVIELRATTRDSLDRIKAKLPNDKREVLEGKARERLAPWGLLPEK